MAGVYPVEHFLEILLLAQERAEVEPDAYRRKVWAVTIRDIETVLADDPLEILEARDRLAQRTDPVGQRLHACACQLLRHYEAADREAKEAINRARDRRWGR